MNEQQKSLASVMDTSVPILEKLGVMTIDLGPGKSVVQVNSTPFHENHIGTIHAGVLFTLAEYTSGSCLFGSLVGDMDKIFCVVKDAHIDYLKGARSSAVASAELPVESIIKARDAAIAGEKVEVPVSVIIKSGDAIASRCRFTWIVRKLR